MFASERIRIIKSILLDKKHIDVSTLSTMLDVSEVTIRRDLEKLEKEEFLERTHGGAILNQQEADSEEGNLELTNDPYLKERLEIGEIASHLIAKNDIILLSQGLTNQCIAKKLLKKQNITVLTNDLTIAEELSSNNSINVILPGGNLDSTSMSLIGKLTEENIRNFYVDKAFIEVEGVSPDRGYTVNSIEKASLLKECLKISKQKIIVCHHSVFYNNSFAQLGLLNSVEKIITNSEMPDYFKKYYFENDIQVFTSLNIYESSFDE
ncbi:DeoR/GlpR family DNA-binding transcription regulator [Desulfosporosinus metallidurans]|uniref:Transcriptional regulator of rhamnose utilization, DeoR family n=1 Tax=Desulfosporosinus metallidurans TaxID=1888891 RepID=A0A1Q8QZD6_9FIRM|nr:DeoR/GlpR family DNA-binding transcription regulator [Desulfosporosinus metallidurans]OLN32739.1 Transcriptional regulator of rhamnose utilization, DeoR family [Desulfosporosinus metallidurans]